jgi:uncharacterized protein (DUF1499 family)
LRAADDHSIEYDGLEVAELQVKAYPDIKTLVIDGDIEKHLQSAENVLNDMNLDIVSVDIESGRIEAVATSFLFGFKDDMVIRMTETDTAQVAVDVRSQSRVGKSDLGQNAKRIRRFMEGLVAHGAGA